MLRYLAHKLRTQSLNEESQYNHKADENHDSGTESDDDTGEDIDDMESEGDSMISHTEDLWAKRDSSSESPLDHSFVDSALPSDSDHNFDHHSSEEELDVINGSTKTYFTVREVLQPEKRKWSQMTRKSFGESSGSSDEEVLGLSSMTTPVEFRASPPADAHKPPPSKIFHVGCNSIADKENAGTNDVCFGAPGLVSLGAEPRLNAASPRKRHRHHARQQRPFLDFEKMQQKKARSAVSGSNWRQGGELSLVVG